MSVSSSHSNNTTHHQLQASASSTCKPVVPLIVPATYTIGGSASHIQIITVTGNYYANAPTHPCPLLLPSPLDAIPTSVLNPIISSVSTPTAVGAELIVLPTHPSVRPSLLVPLPTIVSNPIIASVPIPTAIVAEQIVSPTIFVEIAPTASAKDSESQPLKRKRRSLSSSYNTRGSSTK